MICKQLEAFEPKWVDSILNVIGVNSLGVGGLQFLYNITLNKLCFFPMNKLLDSESVKLYQYLKNVPSISQEEYSNRIYSLKNNTSYEFFMLLWLYR